MKGSVQVVTAGIYSGQAVRLVAFCLSQPLGRKPNAVSKCTCSQFFVKPTRARRQNAEAAQWWLARKDVRGILTQGLKDGNLKLPPYVSL